MDLRKAFFKEMADIARWEPHTILLVGDLGYSFMEEYEKKFPDNFMNCGIAEQNMIGVAAGMARGGLKPYVYSNSIFILMRAYEQVRDDIAYANLDVKLIGTGAADFLGFTHNLSGHESMEDLIKGLPNINQHYPQNEYELQDYLRTTGPAFIQL